MELPSPHPRRSPDVAWRTLEGEAVLLQLETGEYFALNATAARVWGLIDGERTIGAIVDEVARGAGAARETVEVDVARLLREMTEQRLLLPPEPSE